MRSSVLAVALIVAAGLVGGARDAWGAGQLALLPIPRGQRLDGAALDRLYDAAPAYAPAVPGQPEVFVQEDRPVRVPLRRGGPAAKAAHLKLIRRLASDPITIDRYDPLIRKYAMRYRLQPRLLKAIIAAESEFIHRARSRKGAVGLMQLMGETAEEMGVSRDRLHDPESNIQAGAAYIGRLFRAASRRFGVQLSNFSQAPLWLVRRVIAAYNAGPRFLVRQRLLRETRLYLSKVMAFYRSQLSDLRLRLG
jgi:hypothetical protein